MTKTLQPELVDIDSVLPDPANARKHPDRNLQAIMASLKRFSQTKPIVVDKDGIVRAGNGTLEAAKRLGWKKIQVVRMGFSGSEATAYAIADNQSSTLGEWNEPELTRLLESLEKEGFDLEDDLAFNEHDMAALNRAATIDEAKAAQDELIEEKPIESAPRRVEPGEIWALGPHRLMCASSFLAHDVEALCAEDRAMLLATDPPYFIGYEGPANHPFSSEEVEGERVDGRGSGAKWDGGDEGIDIPETYAKYLRSWLPRCDERVPIYQWYAWKKTRETLEAWERAGLLCHQTIVWAKANGVTGHSHYSVAAEPALYGWREGFQPEPTRRPPIGVRSVWESGLDPDPKIHRTGKPTILWERPILYHTKPGEWIAEPFAGSGTAIIAAEKHERRCLAMEIDEIACDKILARYEAFTSTSPVKLTSSR